MALTHCAPVGCGTYYAVGLLSCPQCGLPADYTGDDVAKITTSGGVSHPEDHQPDWLPLSASVPPEPVEAPVVPEVALEAPVAPEPGPEPVAPPVL